MPVPVSIVTKSAATTRQAIVLPAASLELALFRAKRL